MFKPQTYLTQHFENIPLKTVEFIVRVYYIDNGQFKTHINSFVKRGATCTSKGAYITA